MYNPGTNISRSFIGSDTTIEVKARATGFAQLYEWLNDRDVLIGRAVQEVLGRGSDVVGGGNRPRGWRRASRPALRLNRGMFRLRHFSLVATRGARPQEGLWVIWRSRPLVDQVRLGC
jgi:hypothetical protein